MRFEARPRKRNDETRPSSDAPGVLPQLPLGSNAFRSPLAAAQGSGAGTSRGPLAIFIGAAVVSSTILGLALAYRPTADPEPVARDTDTVPRATRTAVSQPTVAAQPRPSVPVAPAAAIVAPPASDQVISAALKKREHQSAQKPRNRRASARAATRPARLRARKAKAVASADPQLPDAPSRAAVIAAMRRVTPAALACFGGEQGVAKVTLFVRGRTGRVTNAHVTGIAGPAGSCIARAVRRAKFPKFQRDRFEISYPFKR